MKLLEGEKIYFAVGTFKDCYKQMLENPHVEICANYEKGFLRYYGTVVMIEDDTLLAKVFEKAPHLTNMYNEKTGHKLGLFTLENATAEMRNQVGIEESFSV